MDNALDMYKTFLASGSEPVEKETQEEGRDLNADDDAVGTELIIDQLSTDKYVSKLAASHLSAEY
ncbi:MAG: hypothetical protein OXC84_01175 [Gammaproteobacteria bacterium]|nr:hypothetical protein [Gammaproteobacteria bacterium]